MLCGVSVHQAEVCLDMLDFLAHGHQLGFSDSIDVAAAYTDSSCTAFLALVESSMHNAWMAVSELKMKCGCNCSVNSFALLSANSCSARIRRSSSFAAAE